MSVGHTPLPFECHRPVARKLDFVLECSLTVTKEYGCSILNNNIGEPDFLCRGLPPTVSGLVFVDGPQRFSLFYNHHFQIMKIYQEL